MKVNLLVRYKWFEIRDNQVLDPERGVQDHTMLMLFTYPNREEAHAAMSQYVDSGRWHGRTFVLLEVFGLE